MTDRKRIVRWLLCAAVSLLCGGAAWAQNSTSTLVFDTCEWDFGTFREEEGKVSHTFTFTNTGRYPVVIEQVKADCGCTAVNYDRAPVRPGGTGTIEVVFDPDRFAGRFTKGVTVFSDGGRNRNLLKVTGTVIGRPLTLEERYPFPLAEGVRAEAMHEAFGYVENGTVRSMAFGLVNTGRKAVTLSFVPVGGTGRLQVAAPQRLAPGQEAMVTLTYDLRGGEPLYGMLSDRVAVTIDGRRSELPVTTNAIGIEPTEEMTAVCEVTPVSHFFGIVEAGSDCTVEVWIANRGRGPMHIRGLQVRRGTTATLTDGTVVEAGRSVRVTVTLHVSEEAYGRVAGGLSFVVNDPARPFREIRLTAETD